jgi:hypothetical protein
MTIEIPGYLRYALPTAREIETALRAMRRALQLEPPAPGPEGPREDETNALAEELARAVPPQVLEPAAGAGRRWLDGRPKLDLAPWLAATDLSASRAGLILCDDLPTAARAAADDTASLSPLRPEQRVQQLVAYAVSEEYFAVRQCLGRAVTGPA